jgi:UDP-4-amino-4,6-dideoxy-N-acetyl-beta-L-altrosamine N-acetyltransferase
MTKTVALRELCHFDRARLRTWRNHPDIRAGMYTDHQISETEHNAWFARRLADNPKLHWILTVDGQPIGLVALTGVEHGRGSMAYYIGEAEYRGKGFGAAGEYLILEKAFIDLDLRKVWCEVLATNVGPIALHKRFGFTHEATLRNHVVKANGAQEVIGLGLMDTEWRAARNEHKARIEANGMTLEMARRYPSETAYFGV